MKARRKFRTFGPEIRPKAILYLRVSSKQQEKSQLSLIRQRQRLEQECLQRDIPLYTVIEDAAASGGSLNRDGMQEALERLKTGEYTMLMTTKLDRIARSTQDVLTLAELSTTQGWHVVVLDGTVRFDTTSATGRMILTMIAAMAQFERDITKERTIEAISVKRERGDSGLIPIELEKRIITLYRKGESMQGVADILNEENIKPLKGGKKWYGSTIFRVIERAKEDDTRDAS